MNSKISLSLLLLAMTSLFTSTKDALASGEQHLVVAVVDSCSSGNLSAADRKPFDEFDAAGHIPYLLPMMSKPRAYSALSICDAVFIPEGAETNHFSQLITEMAGVMKRPVIKTPGTVTGIITSPHTNAINTIPIVGIADYCSYFTNVCARANVIEAQELVGFASIVIPELPDESVSILLDRCDAVMIGGGIGKRQDYRRRVNFEKRVLALAVPRKMPIAGICHGSQIINEFFGGQLGPTPKDSPVYHNIDPNGCPNDTLHKTKNEPNSLMARVYGAGESTVNSAHSKCSTTAAPGLRVTSRSSDGVIEAFEHETLPVRAFQFHPEWLWKIDNRALSLIKGALTK